MSITLPASLISSLVIGGVIVESDPNDAVTSLMADYVTNVLRFTIKGGTTTGAAFAPGQVATTYEFVIDALTGKWFVNGSAITGTLSGVALTSIQTTFKNLRNSAETLAVNQNLLPGATQVPW
jgi:hypothetical protein